MHFIRVSKTNFHDFRTMPKIFRWFLEVAEWPSVHSLKPIATLDNSYHWLEYFEWRLNKSFQLNGFMTSRWEFWVRNWRVPSFMTVQWTSNVGGQRVRQGSFCHVQLISPKIIPSELLNNLLCGKAPPRDLTPYTFIIEGARRVFWGGWSLPV